MNKKSFILLGNLLDHYDNALYAFLVPVFAHLIFNETDPVVALILSYGLMSSSIISRPIGAFIFSYLTHRFGPKLSMSLSLIGIGFSTGCLGIIPTYQEFGWKAPICIAIIRFFQGIFAAGENTVVVTYLLSYYHKEDHGKANSYHQSSMLIGILIASIFSTWVAWMPSDLEAWRWPFILGSITAFVGVLYRQAFEEDIDITFKSKKYSFRILCGVVSLSSFSYVIYAIAFVFMNSFVPLITEVTYFQMLELNTYLLIFDLVSVYIIGSIIDRFSFKIVLKSSLLIGIIFIPILFYSLLNANFEYIIIIRMIIVLIGVTFCIPLNGFLMYYLPRSYHYSMIGIGTAISGELFGKSTSAICLWLWYSTGNVLAPTLYIIFIGIIGLYGLRSLSQNPKKYVIHKTSNVYNNLG